MPHSLIFSFLQSIIGTSYTGTENEATNDTERREERKQAARNEIERLMTGYFPLAIIYHARMTNIQFFRDLKRHLADSGGLPSEIRLNTRDWESHRGYFIDLAKQLLSEDRDGSTASDDVTARLLYLRYEQKVSSGLSEPKFADSSFVADLYEAARLSREQEEMSFSCSTEGDHTHGTGGTTGNSGNDSSISDAKASFQTAEQTYSWTWSSEPV